MTFLFLSRIRGGYRLARMGVQTMRDLYQVLRQKELDLERTRAEIEALRSVIPLLSEEMERNEKARPTLASSAPQPRRPTTGAD